MNYYLDNDQAADNFAINVKKFITKTPFNRILLFHETEELLHTEKWAH